MQTSKCSLVWISQDVLTWFKVSLGSILADSVFTLSVWMSPAGACSLSLLHTLCVHQVSVSLPQTINHIKLFWVFLDEGVPHLKSGLCSYSTLFIFLNHRSFYSKLALHNPKSLYNYHLQMLDNWYIPMATDFIISEEDNTLVLRNQRSHNLLV